MIVHLINICCLPGTWTGARNRIVWYHTVFFFFFFSELDVQLNKELPLIMIQVMKGLMRRAVGKYSR